MEPPLSDVSVKLQERSFLSTTMGAVAWGSPRGSTPRSVSPAPTDEVPVLKNQHGRDHKTDNMYGISLRKYPVGCPPLRTRWFYAIDVPKRKPVFLKDPGIDSKPLPAPKKFIAFSTHDSRSIETTYQKLLGEHEDQLQEQSGVNNNETSVPGTHSKQDRDNKTHDDFMSARVPVHEDFLFDVDVSRREISPAYWLGPAYEVRRGSWFYTEGSNLRPCEENLAAQLEEGYLKVKPFQYRNSPEPIDPKQAQNSGVGSDAMISSGMFGIRSKAGFNEATAKASPEDTKHQNQTDCEMTGSINTHTSESHRPQSYRLFGTYMNSLVTYQDSNFAWLTSDNIMSRVSSTVYQKFAGGGYLGGVKLVRGFLVPDKGNKDLSKKTPPGPAPVEPDLTLLTEADKQQQESNHKIYIPSENIPSVATDQESVVQSKTASTTGISPFDRAIHYDEESEDVRKQDENEMENGYNDSEKENQGREIDHLILVTHGIGQKLGIRTESVNFIHDVNQLRKTLKSVYINSADLQALNCEVDKLDKNCRIQVLPVCWRHLLDFPHKGVRQNRRDCDLGETIEEEEAYPSLEDITVEGVPFVRSLITDLALDILLYQSAYREHIIKIVLAESNRIHRLFCRRNPNFRGNVSLIGHSLGSAILFDILSRQKEARNARSQSFDNVGYMDVKQTDRKDAEHNLQLNFDVEDFYCLGSPIGLFQMLKGKTVAARHQTGTLPSESSTNFGIVDDPSLGSRTSNRGSRSKIDPSSIAGLPFNVSSPKVGQLYNIFYPTDPISYRLEPLISPAMKSLKPQLLPYTKRGIFGASAAQGLTGIGTKVGQSVSGLWSSLSGGISSSFLNRSSGLAAEDVARIDSSQSASPRPYSYPIGAGTNISAGGVIHDPFQPSREHSDGKKRQLADETAAAGREGSQSFAPTLMDSEIETLYSVYQKARESSQTGDRSQQEELTNEQQGKRLKTEELKVRALNRSGRVDFSIQESVLDFNPINTIASHLSYWGDEDVSHFMMSQLLSRHRKPVMLSKTL